LTAKAEPIDNPVNPLNPVHYLLSGEGVIIPDTTNLIVFMAATLALNLTPGPDMLYVIARSVGQGQRAGVVSALGIGGGCLAHTFAAAFGLSALLMSSAVAYDLVKTTINEFTTKLAKHRARNLPSHRGVD